MSALIAALKTKLLLGNGPASQQATAIMLYQEQKQTVVDKRADVERLHRYAIRERRHEHEQDPFSPLLPPMACL